MTPFGRRGAVARLLERRGDALVVTGLGTPTWDVAAAGDTDANFYLWGAMGGAAMVGLGLAMAQPNRRVVVVTGDGEMLMGLGSLATIAVAAPQNLVIAVLNNRLYGETGGQPSHADGVTDLVAVAQGAGIADARRIGSAEALEGLADEIGNPGRGPVFADIPVTDGGEARVLPSRDGPWLARRFRAGLALQN
ncbi:MAG: thiamine pyrophosphate-dependent enzyme [Pseudomonadota bacterium]